MTEDCVCVCVCDNKFMKTKVKTNSIFLWFEMDRLQIKSELIVDSILSKRTSPDGKVNKELISINEGTDSLFSSTR